MILDPLIWIRGLHFAATLLAAGTVSFTVLVAGPSRRMNRMTGAALAVTVLSGAVWLGVVAAGIVETPIQALGAADIWTVVTSTRFGQIAGLRLGCAVALGLLLAAPAFSGRLFLQLAAASALTGLLALVGHAGATPGGMGWLHFASDLVHVLAAAAWLGGLPALVMVLSGPPGPAIASTARFSTLGLVAVAALLVSGVINSWQLLNGPNDLIATTYGRVLLLKIGLFAAMVGVAAVNRLSVSPRMPATIRVLRRNSLIETGLGIAVLALVGALGTMVPGGHVHTETAAPQSQAAFVHIHTEQVMADVTIEPGENRNNTATIRLSREDSTDYPAIAVKLIIAPRDGGSPAIESAATRTADDTWQIETLAIPHAGVWNLQLTIAVSRSQAFSIDAPIVITQCSNECW